MISAISRRLALKRLALAGVSLPLLGRVTTAQAGETKAPSAPQLGFKLGVATVTLKSLPLEQMLQAVKRVGLEHISLFKAHSLWENSPAQWSATAGKIRATGITPACCGVLYLKNDEKEMRRMLDYVRALGVPLFSCSPEPAALPLLERLVKEYDLQAALHNHGPEDKVWPAPEGIWQAIESRDARLGLCLDVGHTFRCGVNPAEVIWQYRSRLYDVHVKDTLADVGAKDTPVEMGRGRIDLPAIFTALIKIGYSQNVWFEYEKDPDDPVPGLAESVGYIRGLLKGLSVV